MLPLFGIERVVDHAPGRVHRRVLAVRCARLCPGLGLDRPLPKAAFDALDDPVLTPRCSMLGLPPRYDWEDANALRLMVEKRTFLMSVSSGRSETGGLLMFFAHRSDPIGRRKAQGLTQMSDRALAEIRKAEQHFV